MSDQCVVEITYTTYNKQKERKSVTLAGFETAIPAIKPSIETPPGSAKTELEALLRMQCVDIFIIYHRMKMLIPYHHEKES